jgi:hypothetical protein
VIPQPLLELTFEHLHRYGRYGSEGLVYWAGSIGAGGDNLVQVVLLVNHRPQGPRVEVSRQEARLLLRTLKELDVKLLAQIHSHPGAAFHSRGDDEHATSFHPGFLSIVVPELGRTQPTLETCAVHEYQEGFRQLSHQEVRERLQILPDAVELQPAPWAEGAPRKGGGVIICNTLKRILKLTAHRRV